MEFTDRIECNSIFDTMKLYSPLTRIDRWRRQVAMLLLRISIIDENERFWFGQNRVLSEDTNHLQVSLGALLLTIGHGFVSVEFKASGSASTQVRGASLVRSDPIGAKNGEEPDSGGRELHASSRVCFQLEIFQIVNTLVL